MSSWSEGKGSRGAQQAERMRQQLEELDGLLRQLLALPIADEPDSSTETKSVEEVDPPSEETPVLRLAVAEASGPIHEEATKPFHEASEEAEAGLDIAPSEAAAASLQMAEQSSPAIIRFEPHSSEVSRTPIEPGPTQVAPGSADVPLRVVSTQERLPTSSDHPASSPLQREGEAPAEPRTPSKLARQEPRPPEAEPAIAYRNQEVTRARYSQQVSGEEPRCGGDQEKRTYWLLTPINRAYDRALAWLGPLGKPLATPAGRNLLGWLGLIMLLGAAALCLGGWLGWTW